VTLYDNFYKHYFATLTPALFHHSRLDANQLSGTVPSTIGSLTNLRALYASRICNFELEMAHSYIVLSPLVADLFG